MTSPVSSRPSPVANPARALVASWTVLYLLAGCPGGDAGTTATEPASTTESDAEASTGGAPTTASPDPSTGPTTGSMPDATSGLTTGGTTGGTGEPLPDETTGGVIPVPPACDDPNAALCDDPITNCVTDMDHDWVTYGCDNAPDVANPGQEDMDGDGFGDVIDLCPLVAGAMDDLSDADRDGVGSGCDVCARPKGTYNKKNASVPFYMRVRNIPAQQDSDHDGVGDACDNCVRVANCQAFGDGPGLTPHVVGQLADVEVAGCQDDLDSDLIGDACVSAQGPGAAGPVGFADDDDFDQDGLANLADFCPRQPVLRKHCTDAADCPDGAPCSAAGICNHADHDGDAVGDVCDTCPWTSNPEQTTEAGAALDDFDGDFIGAACEQGEFCVERMNARPIAFYDVSANGFCCVTTYRGQPLLDPDGQPIDPAELGPLPPGVLELPPGCDEALASSADGEAHPMKACHVDSPLDLWRYLCVLPGRDQDYDGLEDACDLCPFAYDPTNAIYVDANMKEWPHSGKYCTGDYSPKNLDPQNMCMP